LRDWRGSTSIIVRNGAPAYWRAIARFEAENGDGRRLAVGTFVVMRDRPALTSIERPIQAEYEALLTAGSRYF
jgi:hypothetical protein